MYKRLFLITASFLLILVAFANFRASNKVENGTIVSGFRNGNFKELSGFLSSGVELGINGQEQICNSGQAEVILKDFFEQNQPTNFTIKVQKSSTQNRNMIYATYQSNAGFFDVYISTNTITQKINELRIEKI
jgi:hypothetical protein